MAALSAYSGPRKQSKVIVDYWPIGGARELWQCKADEILIEGPAGTGKTVACLQKIHRALGKYAGARILVARKTQKSLKASTLVTYKQKVVHPLDGVDFYGGSDSEPAAFRYPNGSRMLLAGLDNPEKIKSSEYDWAYLNEATEATDEDWEMVSARLRNGVIPYQQLIGDANPTFPSHWLNQRCNTGQTTRILSRHIENPRYFDPKSLKPTEEGAAYLTKLENLTGVRRLRLLDGKWVAAEGQVLDRWERAVHVVRRDQLADLGLDKARRHVAGVDWGWTKPGVIEVAAIGGDQQMAIVHEVYQTRRTQDWWVAKALDLQAKYDIEVFICDPSEPAYIEAFIAAGLNAIGAENAILPGITAVQERLGVDDNGRARLYVVEDALEEVDMSLREAAQPTSLVEEIDSYVWAQNGAGRREKPVDEFNHGVDPLRYLTLYVDGGPAGWDAYDTENMHGWLQSMGVAA